MTAFGWRYSSYEFKNTLSFEPNKTLAYAKDSDIKCSEFDIHQLQIPLMVYFQSNKIKGLGKVGIGFGGYGGLLVHQEHESCLETMIFPALGKIQISEMLKWVFGLIFSVKLFV